MKKRVFQILMLTAFFSVCVLFSQDFHLKDFFDKSKVKDYEKKVLENEIYPEQNKFIVHNFTISEKDFVIDKGVIYRQFFKKGTYESFFAVSERQTYKICYWSDPTALITANVNKLEYCIEEDINNILFPMVIRGYSKILKSGKVEKKFKNMTFTVKKLSTKKEKDIRMTTFQVTSTPKVIEGTIEAYNGLIVLRGNLKINNDLAKRSGLKLLFSHDDLPKSSIINLTFDYNYFENKKPDKFTEIDIEEVIKKYTNIECD